MINVIILQFSVLTVFTYVYHLKGLAQAKIIKKIGDFILGSVYDHMM